MSQAKNRYEAERWLRTAEEDLRAVEVLLQAGAYAQACFYAQQSGEKAIKSLWHLIDADAWGHSVQRLILEFPERSRLPDLEQWLERGALLDKFYIPTRYPNGLPDLTPGQVYTLDDAQRGLQAARLLLEACRKWMEQH
ncbi:MAG: HEPN domain-containing protein [Roseiflexus sp.]|nr:HEPN domain-containing protein [Roseiflexus sp.]MDW8328269.1 HEPN domain-containing protein [Anaerolineales bacterium]